MLREIHALTPSQTDAVLRAVLTTVSKARYHLSAKHKGFDPLRVYYTSPSLLDEWVAPEYGFRVRDAGKVVGGEWDLNGRRFDEYVIYRSLVDRFEAGRSWEETPLYQRYARRVRNGETCWHGCSSVEEVRQRCAYVDRLYASIRENGYLHQSELDGPQQRKTVVYPSAQREISVNVGRDGRLLLLDGRHRLAIAKILGIEEIPVHIAVVHAGWDGGLPEGVYAT